MKISIQFRISDFEFSLFLLLVRICLEFKICDLCFIWNTVIFRKVYRTQLISDV